MKNKKVWMVVAAIVLVLSVLVIVVITKFPKKLSVDMNGIILSEVADGRYTGRCDNGLVVVGVEVEVINHRITQIDIVEHQNGLGEPAEEIVAMIIREQSLDVDAIAGATASSQSILKAVENALQQGMEG